MEWIVNWWMVTILGPIVLAAVLAYALLTRRRLTPRERRDQKDATENAYREDGG
ncbi:MAG: hypothetical protein ABTQ31_12605 [Rhizobiaceae bacterium]